MGNDVTPIQEKCFQMIIAAGDAKAVFAQSLQMAAEGNKEEADKLYEEGLESMNQAHCLEAELMSIYGGDATAVPGDLLMIHANDHLSMALSMQTVCDQMRPVVETVYELRKKLV